MAARRGGAVVLLAGVARAFAGVDARASACVEGSVRVLEQPAAAIAMRTIDNRVLSFIRFGSEEY